MPLRKDRKRRRLLATLALPPAASDGGSGGATGSGRYVDASGEPDQKMCPFNAGICLVNPACSAGGNTQMPHAGECQVLDGIAEHFYCLILS
jgi:hypothetical protein